MNGNEKIHKNNHITIEYLNNCFNETNGHLFWKTRPLNHFKDETRQKRWNKRYSGKEAGTKHEFKEHGKIRFRYVVKIEKVQTLRYHIVWAMKNSGEWTNFIDHKDRDSTNDIIENLRKCNHFQNNANRVINKNNKSGYKGVRFRQGKWQARIVSKGKEWHLGYFDSAEEASKAYLESSKEIHGEFAYDGTRD